MTISELFLLDKWFSIWVTWVHLSVHFDQKGKIVHGILMGLIIIITGIMCTDSVPGRYVSFLSVRDESTI